MPNPKMGGKELFRIFLKGNQDLTHLLLRGEGGGRLEQGVRDFVEEKYQRTVHVEVIHESCGRSDLLLQGLDMVLNPDELSQHGLLGHRELASQFHSRLFAENDLDVVVFSIQQEVAHSLWRHQEQGYLFYPDSGWEQKWTPLQKEWFFKSSSPVGLVDVNQFKENFIRIVRAVKKQLDAHVLVYNCSPIDRHDRTHNYHGLDDTLPVRVEKFNLALMEISALEGISVIDVDRIIAELGAENHVLGFLKYSPEAYEAICRESIRVLEDIGFFENRPLVMQMGRPPEGFSIDNKRIGGV